DGKAGTDGDGNTRAVLHVKAFYLAGVAHVEAAVGQHTVHIKGKKADAFDAIEDALFEIRSHVYESGLRGGAALGCRLETTTTGLATTVRRKAIAGAKGTVRQRAPIAHGFLHRKQAGAFI